MVTIKQLMHALALDRHRNFHRAAEAEHISQSAFSRSISALEKELGVLLFDRHGGDVTPTLYGNAMLRYARNLFRETSEMTRELELLKGLEAGHLDVAAGLYAADLSASRAMGMLINRHPELRLRIRLLPWQQVPDYVASGKVDLGISEISMLLDSHDLLVEPVASHQVLFFCRAEHPLASTKAVSRTDLDAFPVVTVRLPPRVADLMPGKKQKDRVNGDVVPHIEVNDMMAARHIVMQSDAFGIATPLQIEPWLRSGELIALSYHADWLKLNYGFITQRNRMLSPAAEAYMQLVRDIDRELERRNIELIEEWLP